MSADPQRGQCTACRVGKRSRGTGPGARRGAGPGGAIPPSASLRRPRGVIQSVVHGGSSTVRIRTRGKPAVDSRAAMEARISAMAGQPL